MGVIKKTMFYTALTVATFYCGWEGHRKYGSIMNYNGSEKQVLDYTVREVMDMSRDTLSESLERILKETKRGE